MSQVIIASDNPVKVNAVKLAFCKAFPDVQFIFNGYKSESGVSDQPMGEEETITGATNRLNYVQTKYPSADFYASIEGGCYILHDNLYTMAWVMVTNGKKVGSARSASLQLPSKIAELVKQGTELGTADDIVFGKSNSKRDNGAVGILTHNLITRTSGLESTVIIALAAFLNPELY